MTAPTANVTTATIGPAVGGAAFNDNFDRGDSDSLGANWTEAAGDADIASNVYRIGTGSYGVVTSVHNTSTGSATQYVKATLDAANDGYPWFVFRYVDSSSGYYAVQFNANTGAVEWYFFADAADTSGDLIGSGTFGFGLVGVTIGATITGTGTATEVRLWGGPSNLPTTASDWDGDTTPNITLTDNPATACDAGQKIGLGGQSASADTYRIDNFYGGGL